MKALLLAATSTLALSGFAFAQTPAPAPATQVTDPAAAADKVEDAADKAENAVDQAVTTGAADKVEDAADKAEDKADDAVTEGTAPAPAADPAADPAMVPADPAAAPVDTPVDAAPAPVVAPDVNAPALSEAAPGMLGSWIMSRHIWTTNQPSSTAWDSATITERPAEWQDIAKVDDLVLDDNGELVGYVADIGGFLGIGAKKVLLGKEAIHFVKTGNDAFFATNFTKEELKALPDFDNKTVMK